MSNSDDMLNLREPTEAELRTAENFEDVLSPEAREGIELVSLEELEPDFSDEFGASSALEAAQEGEPWFPPTDPVIVPAGNDQGAAFITGGLDAANDDLFRASDVADEDVAMTDDELAGAVQEALATDALTHAFPIRVSAEDGVVTLRGNVEHISDAEAAESVAGRVPGVVEVREELQVGAL